ncbi:hypothetical protein RB213_005099 [Colletotrichum asianum]
MSPALALPGLPVNQLTTAAQFRHQTAAQHILHALGASTAEGQRQGENTPRSMEVPREDPNQVQLRQ